MGTKNPLKISYLQMFIAIQLYCKDLFMVRGQDESLRVMNNPNYRRKSYAFAEACNAVISQPIAAKTTVGNSYSLIRSMNTEVKQGAF